MDSKYIIYDSSAYIFPLCVNHDEFAANMCMEKDNIQGAGFIMNNGKIICYGKSVSLGIDGGEEDTIFVNKLLGITP